MTMDLVIGYGNDLRSDDGIGPRVAEEIAWKQWDGVRGIACRQLTPELASEVAKARRVVFVDASVDPAQPIRLSPLRADGAAAGAGHTSDPGVILGMAEQLYGGRPEAWTLTIPAESLAVGDKLSAAASKNICVALGRICSLLGLGLKGDKLTGCCWRCCAGRLSCPIGQ